MRDYRTRRQTYYERVNGRYLDPDGNVQLVQWSKYWEWVNGFAATQGAAPRDDLRLSTPTQSVDRRGPAVDDRE